MTVSTRNQIPCTAERLSQLQPEMLQAVTPGSAFSIGQQYFAERRVRIIRAGDREIACEVAGAGGLYQQTIALADGYLVMKCSCPSKERPLCRHGVAALLEYQRSSRTESAAHMPQSTEPSREGVSCDAVRSESDGLGVRLREIAVFLDWMQSAVQAVNEERSLPPASPDCTGNALQWVRAMQQLDERASRSEQEAAALRADLGAQRDRMDGMAGKLDSVKLELEHCRGIARTLLEKEREWSLLAGTIQNMTSDMMKKAADVDRLVAGLRSQGACPP